MRLKPRGYICDLVNGVKASWLRLLEANGVKTSWLRLLEANEVKASWLHAL